MLSRSCCGASPDGPCPCKFLCGTCFVTPIQGLQTNLRLKKLRVAEKVRNISALGEEKLGAFSASSENFAREKEGKKKAFFLPSFSCLLLLRKQLKTLINKAVNRRQKEGAFFLPSFFPREIPARSGKKEGRNEAFFLPSCFFFFRPDFEEKSREGKRWPSFRFFFRQERKK